MPARSRRRSRGGPAPTRTSGGSENTAVEPVRTGGEEPKRGGILGWFQDAGDWVGDRYDEVAEGVGNAIETTKRVASDVWDVVETTSVSWEDGRIGVETDLDEVMDLMPESVREKIQLGDGAENKIKLEYDTSSNSLNASSADLEIEGMDLGGLQSGPASFKDVSVRIHNPADAIGMLENPREWLGDDEDGVSIDVSVGSGSAENLVIPGENGGTTIRRADLSNFRGSASNADGLPFGDEALATSARFSAGGLGLSGVTHGGAEVGDLDITDIAGGLSERDETAFLEVGAVRAAGVDSGDGASMAAMTADNIRVDIRNEGGGMVFLDDKGDHMNAVVTASSATVGGVETLGASADSARVSDLSLTADQDTSTLDLAAGALGGTNLRHGDNRVGGVDAQGLNARLSPGDWSAELDQGSITAAALAGWNVDGASVAGLSVGNDGSGISGNADRASVTGLSGEGTRVGQADLTQLSGAQTADGWEAAVGGGTASNVRAMGATVGSASLDNARATSSGDRIEGAVDRLSVRDAAGMGAHVDGATLTGLNGSKDADGWEAGLAGGTVTGASYDELAVDSAAISAVRASGNDAGMNADIGRVAADGMSTTDGSRIDHLHGNTVALNTRGGGLDASAAELGVRGVGIGEVGLTEGTLTGTSARMTSEGTSLGADQVALTGFTAKDFAAGSLSANDATAELGQDGMSAHVADASLADVRAGDLGVRRASITDAGGSVIGDRRSTTIAAVDATGITYGDGVSVADASVRGIAGSSEGDSAFRGSIDSVSANTLVAGDTTVAHASATGISGGTEGDAIRGTVATANASTLTSGDLSVGSASLDAARFGTDGTTHDAYVNRIELADASMGDSGSVRAAAIYGARGQTDGTSIDAGADRFDARGLAFASSPDGGQQSGGDSGLDSAALTRTLAARVDSADARVSVPMIPGTYDSGVELGVERDTQLNAGLSVRNNQIADVDARFSRGLDGPAWTELRGLYDDNGRLKADVSGWADKDLTGTVNEAMGIESNRLQSLEAYGYYATQGTGGTTTEAGDHPALTEAFDTRGLRAEGHAHLSAGTIDAGVGQVRLADGGSGANTFSASVANGQANVSAGSVLIDSSAAQVAGGQLTTGDAAIDGTRVRVDTAGTDAGSAEGTVDSVSVQDIRYRR